MHIRPVIRKCHLTDIMYQETTQARTAAVKELEAQFGRLGKYDDKDKEVWSA